MNFSRTLSLHYRAQLKFTKSISVLVVYNGPWMMPQKHWVPDEWKDKVREWSRTHAHRAFHSHAHTPRILSAAREEAQAGGWLTSAVTGRGDRRGVTRGDNG